MTKYFGNPKLLRLRVIERGINFTNAALGAGIEIDEWYDALHADRELSLEVAQKLRNKFGSDVITEVSDETLQ